MKIDINTIVESPNQKRIPDPVAVRELADAIQADGGIKQKPRVRPTNNSHYEVVYGHRRIEAARLLGWTEIDCDVEKLTDLQAHRLTISENKNRANLSPLETALEMRSAREVFGMDETAKMFGVTQATILAYLRILELPIEIQELVHQGKIAKSAVPAMLAFYNIFGAEQVLGIYKEAAREAGDVGSHKLIDKMENQLKWQSRAQFTELYSRDRELYAFPIDRAFPLKSTLDPKKDKLMTMANISDGNAYDKLRMQIKGGLEMLAQPWLAEGLTQMQVEKVVVFTSPPACNVCPFKVTILETVSCSFKPCLKRKKDSWTWLKFNEYAEETGLQKYSEKADGKGLAIARSHYRLTDDERKGDGYAKMIAEGKTSKLRIEPRFTDSGVWVGTLTKYARLIDVSPKGIKKAQELHEERVEDRSGGNGYNSPEAIAQRKLYSDRRDTFDAFYRNHIIDLVESVMAISLPELQIILGVDDDDVKRNWENTRITKANRLSLYRKCFLLDRARNMFGWAKWDDIDPLTHINEKVKPALIALGIWETVPEEFSIMAQSFVENMLAELSEVKEEEAGDSDGDPEEVFEDDEDDSMEEEE